VIQILRASYKTGAVLLAATLLLMLSGCYDPYVPPPAPPDPTASFEITEWAQDYYEYSGAYSSFVYVYYKITNTGAVDIDYYQVWIEVTCADGSKYQEWTNGLDVARGTYATDYTLINVAGKRVVSANITKYELTSYSW